MIGAPLIVGSLAFVALNAFRGPKEVTIGYKPISVGVKCSISVQPSEVIIATNKWKNFGKTKHVKWVVAAAQERKYLWKILGKKGDSRLEPRDHITCGDRGRPSRKTKISGDWEYNVEVWTCDGSVKLCSIDPKVRVKD